jgi:tetratricopeptide (TPR) repeat protein
MLQAAALVLAVAAAQETATVRVPYVQIVEQYGPGTEERAVLALRRLDLDSPSQAFDELDRRCVEAGARSCAPKDVLRAGTDVRHRILVDWGRLYPRVLAIHIEALVASHAVTEREAMAVHRNVILRLIARLDDLAERGGAPASFATLATQARHVLVWALQFHRDARWLAGVLETFGDAVPRDVDLLLARAQLEELRAAPDAVAATVQQRNVMSAMSREVTLAQEEARQLNAAARVYAQVLALDGSNIEAHVRLARILARLGRLDPAETHLRSAQKLPCDRRQTYLIALFLADIAERRGRRGDARAAYVAAQNAWPDAQASAIGLARLRALDGALDEARAALRIVRRSPKPGPLDRSDPWLGYDGGQAWRLPDAMRALQASFEPLP